VTLAHEEDKLIVFEKGPLLFVFNFHHSKSFEDYKVGTFWETDHILVYDTDQASLGGHNRLSEAYGQRFVSSKISWHDRPNQLRLYLPCRTACVYIAEQNVTDDIKQLGVVIPPI